MIYEVVINYNSCSACQCEAFGNRTRKSRWEMVGFMFAAFEVGDYSRWTCESWGDSSLQCKESEEILRMLTVSMRDSNNLLDLQEARNIKYRKMLMTRQSVKGLSLKRLDKELERITKELKAVLNAMSVSTY